MAPLAEQLERSALIPAASRFGITTTLGQQHTA
jgi:hypothetical protein